VFQWVQANGGHTVAVASTSLIPQSELTMAQSFFGIDTVISAERDLEPIVQRAVELAAGANPPALLFVHVPTVDFAGHDFGWIRADTAGDAGADVLGTQYIDAVHAADAAIGRIWNAVESSVDSGTTAFILAADHGGGHGVGCVEGIAPSREHCTSALGDREIPLVLIAKGQTPRQLAPGTRITQIAPTIGQLMGLEIPTLADSPLFR
jgi:predicted AlkP superfamily pyrophosphatase or phosphodiesterase